MTKKIVNICLLVLFSTAVYSLPAQTKTESSALQYHTRTAASVTLQWAVKDKNLYVILSAPTDGWVAVGFEPTRMMKDANIIIGYVKGKKVVIDDQFGVRPTSHAPDTDLGGTNDVTILGGSDIGGTTTLKFSIPLDSSDTFDRKIERGTAYTVLVAYGVKDNLYAYHKRRGTLKITF